MVFDSSIDLGTVLSFHYVHVVELRQCSIILIQTTEYSNLYNPNNNFMYAMRPLWV